MYHVIQINYTHILIIKIWKKILRRDGKIIVLIISVVFRKMKYLPNSSVVFEGPFQIDGALAEKNVIAVGAEIPQGHLDCPLH